MVHFAKSSDLKLTCVLSLGALNEINWNITENTPGSHWEHNRSSPRIQRGSHRLRTWWLQTVKPKAERTENTRTLSF